MSSVALLVLAKNEEHNIVDCLESARGCDELIVIDDNSTDRTVALAEAQGARVVNHTLTGFADQFNFARDQAQSDWIFYLDADERLSPGLVEDLRRHMAEYPNMVGTIKRRNFAFGARHRFGVLRPDRVPRLFPRQSINWQGLVHPFPDFSLPTKPLRGHLIHFTYRDWHHYFNKYNQYTTLWAAEAYRRGKRTGQAEAWGRAAWSLFKMLVINGGLLGGPLTWLLCFHHFGYTMTKYLKLIEIQERS